jgi:hypothetical protein
VALAGSDAYFINVDIGVDTAGNAVILWEDEQVSDDDRVSHTPQARYYSAAGQSIRLKEAKALFNRSLAMNTNGSYAIVGLASGPNDQFFVFGENIGSRGASPETRLTVAKQGAGKGKVTSTPQGITCGNRCAKNFRLGKTVVLKAAPASTSRFVGWSGDCAGSARKCRVSLDTDKDVAAIFEPRN